METGWSNYEKIEQSIKISDIENMKNEIETVLNEWRNEQDKIALETIENLTKEQLASYIESSFKHSDWWDNYSTMMWNRYYWFMVQSALDFLSDKYQDKKFDENGEENEDGKSLDDWIELWWGIDNKVGSKTKTAVRIAQKILWINVDWCAGPQFFAKICSVLKNENISDFKVRWYDENNKYKYSFDDSNSSINNESFNYWEWAWNWAVDNIDSNWNEKIKTIEDVKKDLEYLNRIYCNCNVFVVKNSDKWQYFALTKWNYNTYFKKDNINAVWTIPLWGSWWVSWSGYNWIDKSMNISWSFAWYDINFSQVKSLIDNAWNDIDMSDSNLLNLADTYFPNKSWWREKNRRKLAKWCFANDERWWRNFIKRWEKMKEKWLSDDMINLKAWMLLYDVDIDNVVC